MAYDALEEVKHRNNFYRDGYHKLIIVLMLALLIIAGLVGIILFMASHKPIPTYFATTDSGRIIPLIPLNQPNLSDQVVLQWTSQAVVSVYSYNFVNYREAFQDNRKYFTDEGWAAFMKAVKGSNNLQAVQEKQLVVSAVLTGAPIVTNEYIVDGRYTWKIQMPITVTFQGSGVSSAQNFVVNLTVRRISTLDNIYGIGISEFVAVQQ